MVNEELVRDVFFISEDASEGFLFSVVDFGNIECCDRPVYHGSRGTEWTPRVLGERCGYFIGVVGDCEAVRLAVFGGESVTEYISLRGVLLGGCGAFCDNECAFPALGEPVLGTVDNPPFDVEPQAVEARQDDSEVSSPAGRRTGQ